MENLVNRVTMRMWRTTGMESGTPQTKAKRTARQDEDSRLGLLLELLNADEQASLKRRLVNDLRADGEALPLADLLESDARHYSS